MQRTSNEYEEKALTALNSAWATGDPSLREAYNVEAQVYATLALAAATVGHNDRSAVDILERLNTDV